MFACFLMFALVSSLFSYVSQRDFYSDLYLFSFTSVLSVCFFMAFKEQTELKHCGIFPLFVLC